MPGPEESRSTSTLTLLRVLLAVQLGSSFLTVLAEDRFAVIHIPREGLAGLEVVHLGVAVLLGLGALVGLVGLWSLWRPARLLYTVSVLPMPLLHLLGPPTEIVAGHAGLFLLELDMLAVGATLALVHFSDLRHRFGRRGEGMPGVAR